MRAMDDSTATTYIGAELATDWRAAEERGLELRLTTADVTQATGINIEPGMVIEYETQADRGKIRVIGLDGSPACDWTAGHTTRSRDVSARAAVTDVDN